MLFIIEVKIDEGRANVRAICENEKQKKVFDRTFISRKLGPTELLKWQAFKISPSLFCNKFILGSDLIKDVEKTIDHLK